MSATPPLSRLESMACSELLELIKLNHAIAHARKAGLDGWEMSLRDTLAKLMAPTSAR